MSAAPAIASRATERVLPPIAVASIGDSDCSLDLPTALRIAAADSLEIQAAQARVAVATARSAEAAAAWLPRLGIGASSSTVDGTLQGVFGEIRDVDFDSARAAIDLGWSLNPGQAAFDQLAVRKIATASAYAAEMSRQAVLVEAFERYHDLVDAGQRVALRESEASLAERRSLLLRARSQSGLESIDASAAADVQASLAVAAVDAARRGYQAASTRLAETLALDPSVTLLPTEDEVTSGLLVDPSLRLTDLMRVAELRNPELARADLLVAAAGYARRAEQWATFGPTVGLALPWHFVGTAFSSLGSSFGYLAGLGFRLGFDGLARIDAAEARQEVAGLEAAGTRLELHGDLVRAYIDRRGADERLVHARRTERLAEQLARAARARLDSGYGDELDVISADERLAAASLEVGLAATATWRAQARLLAAVGEVSPESLWPTSAGGS